MFVISWKNPGAEDRDLGLDDYDHLGVRGGAGCDRRGRARASRCMRCGYCLGGTLLAMAAAALGRDGDRGAEDA